MPLNDLRLTAYHEAGHAVVRVVGGHARGAQSPSFKSIEVCPSENAAGDFGMVEGVGRIVFDSSSDLCRFLEWDIVDSLAGPAAEQLSFYIREAETEDDLEDARLGAHLALHSWLENAISTGAMEQSEQFADSAHAIAQHQRLQSLSADCPSLESFINLACDTIADNWGAVETLAGTLIEHRRLTYAEAFPIIEAGLGRTLAGGAARAD